MKNNDVLFLCQFFYPEFISSATLPFDTAQACAKAGLKVSVICGMPKEYHTGEKVSKYECVDEIEINRVKYLQLNRKRSISRLINYFSFTVAVLFNMRKMKNMRQIVVYSNPPIIPVIAVLAKKMYQCQVTYVSYDVYPEIAIVTNTIKANSLVSKLMSRINDIGYSTFDNVIALSNDMKNKLAVLRPQIDDHKIKVIPNWFDETPGEQYTNEILNANKRELGASGKFVVSYFGNIGVCQELTTILDAIRSLQNDSVFFHFAGHGSLMNDLKLIVEEEQLKNVIISDYMHGEDFDIALQISDCFIVSLKKEVTGLAVPSKTYSYMKTGKPVIAIMNGSTDIAIELIDEHAGYVIHEDDSEALKASILELANDIEKAELMGRNARSVFEEKYTKAICTKKYVDLLNHI